MDTKLEDPCICGHYAGFHSDDIKEYSFTPKEFPIKIVHKFTRCTWVDRTKFDYSSSDGRPHMNPDCDCQGFKLDNLRYLEEKSKDVSS